MPGRFLSVFRPISRLMPEVKAPERRIKLTEKLLWTALVLVLYLVMSEIPLYGLAAEGGADPFFFSRVIFASSKGTLMELGIQPMITANMILQMLAGSGLIGVNFSSYEDRAIFTGVTKFFSIVMTAAIALAYLFFGNFGAISPLASAVIFAQLLAVGVLIIILDELLQKGWGLGSGTSLFIVAGVTQRILWNTLSPLPTGEAGEALGAVIGYVQSLVAGVDPFAGFISRADPNAPTMLSFVLTIVLFVIIIYLSSLKVEIPATYARFRGFGQRYPIKLLYLSTIPVILSQSLLMDIYFVAQLIITRFNADGANVFLNLLGQVDPANPNTPIGGLMYYVIPPRSLENVVADPLRALVYAGIMIASTVTFSVVWMAVSGLDPSSVARQFVDAGLQVPGHRRSQLAIQRILERYIPTVAVLGGIAVGAMAAFADFFSVFGTAMGVLITVDVMQQYYQKIAEETLIEEYPLLGKLV